MSYGKFIFRRPSSRPFQTPIYKQIVMGGFTAPPPERERPFRHRKPPHTYFRRRDLQRENRLRTIVTSQPLVPGFGMPFQHRNPLDPTLRIFQQENLVRRSVFGVTPAPPDVGFIYRQRERRNIKSVLDARQQFRRNAARRTVRTPSLHTPGFLEIIRQRTERYGKLHAREIFDVRDVFRERFGVTPPPDVSKTHLRIRRIHRARKRERNISIGNPRIFGVAALPPDTSKIFVRQQRPSAKERRVRFFKSLSFRRAAVATADVSQIFKRIQRSALFEIKEFRKARHIRNTMSLGIPPVPGGGIGWMVSYIIKRVYGHNLRR